MTIEALLTSIDQRLGVLVTLLGTEGGEVAGAATPATAPTGRRRGRPAADDPKPATTATPVATPAANTVATAQQAAAVDVDPFDTPAPVVAPAVKADKAAARAALEKFRQRLKAQNIAVSGDSEADAENKATARALAWLKEVTGFPTLAGIPEDKFQVIVDKEPTAK